MSRAAKYAAERRARITRDILSSDPTISDADLADAVDDAIADAEFDDHADREELRALGRLPGQEDSPCIENGVDNCDDAGTGEGRYHGRM